MSDDSTVFDDKELFELFKEGEDVLDKRLKEHIKKIIGDIEI